MGPHLDDLQPEGKEAEAPESERERKRPRRRRARRVATALE